MTSKQCYSILELLKGGICDITYSKYLMWDGLQANFHEDWFRHPSNVKAIYLDALRGCNVGIPDGKDF
jgi:hypothetical protein